MYLWCEWCSSGVSSVVCQSGEWCGGGMTGTDVSNAAPWCVVIQW